MKNKDQVINLETNVPTCIQQLPTTSQMIKSNFTHKFNEDRLRGPRSGNSVS